MASCDRGGQPSSRRERGVAKTSTSSLLTVAAAALCAVAVVPSSAAADVDGHVAAVRAELSNVGNPCSASSEVGVARLVRICENGRIDRLEVPSLSHPGYPETIVRPARGPDGAVGVVDKVEWAEPAPADAGGAATASAGTPCDDGRSNVLPGLGGAWGFNAYNYYTNGDYLAQLPLGTANNRDAAIDDIGIGTRDWQGLRNPGCSTSWRQGGTYGPSVDNIGHLYSVRSGDCSATSCRASLLSDGLIGGDGVANGRNEIVAGRYHTGDPKMDGALAYARTRFNGSGSPVEADISFNARLSYCSADAQHDTCTGTVNRYSVRDAARHEVGHALGWDHTCPADAGCSKNTMDRYVYGTGTGAPYYIGLGEVNLMKFVYGATP